MRSLLLGRQTFVEQDDTEPQMKWTLIDLASSNDPDTGDIYTGLDRFGRVKDNRWYNYDADEDVDRIQYGYDRASSRIWRKNVVAAALGKQFDELYTYDGVHRLKDMVRGTLNGGHTALASETFAESWTLDSTGNWRGFKQDDNGDGTWSLIQSRTANPVNEITDIAESVGPSWATPAYNRAGNMATMPQPTDPTANYTATYDAWNRLVKIADGADTVSEYAYDAAKRRIVQKSYVDGTLDETRHQYYTQPSQWQVIEERLGTSPDSANAERQFVWGLRYIDDLIVRDSDTNSNGSLDERLFACQDANWNVTATVDGSETVQERYAYSSYGQPAFLTAGFVGQRTTSLSWTVLFAGYRWDIASKLVHVRHRDYNPVTAVWLQRDPLINDSIAIDLYSYVESRPILWTDPFGLSPKVIAGACCATCFSYLIAAAAALGPCMTAFPKSIQDAMDCVSESVAFGYCNGPLVTQFTLAAACGVCTGAGVAVGAYVCSKLTFNPSYVGMCVITLGALLTDIVDRVLCD